MFLEIITPDKLLYSGNVDLIQLPGTKGLFEILNNHAPLVSTLKKGKIKIIPAQQAAGEEQKIPKFFEINSGVIKVKKNKVIILAE